MRSFHPNRFVLSASVVMAAMLLMPRCSLAWGREGHEIVALIGESRLNPAAKAAIADLLGGASMAQIANWADDIRRQRDETGPWHFVDIPFEMKGFDETRDGQSGNNVVDKLIEFATVLNNRGAPRDKRVEALKFVVHFMGDLHQPMHCADRNGDRGGNFRLVFFLDEPKAVNLHKVWDTVILKHSMADGDMSSKAYAEKLAAAIDPKQAKAWSRGDPMQWANESHQLAVEVVYAGIPVDGPPPKMTEQYLQTAAPVVDAQLQRGGVRLADLLNRIFH